MTEPSPLVSFVVPCYKLGHLLSDCLTSILGQSYSNLEVLVMDDSSPDETPAVMSRFQDSRITYVRNEQNIGHLRNYNRGFELAHGKYVWLISADDVLRDRQVVERFVDVLERHPRVGYVFCPAVRFNAHGDLGVYGSHGSEDRVFDGRRFLRQHLVHGNSIPAAAGMVRNSCYRKLGGFPLDMPFAGDWYMWSLIALHFDVAYLARPMVGYRAHEGNMTLDFKERPDALVADMVRVLWRMKREVESQGHRSLRRIYIESLATEYAWRVIHPTREGYRMSLAEVEESLAIYARRSRESGQIRSRVYAALGDSEYDLGNHRKASEYYAASLSCRPMSLRTRVKSWLARRGAHGQQIRTSLISCRDVWRRANSSIRTFKRANPRATASSS